MQSLKRTLLVIVLALCAGATLSAIEAAPLNQAAWKENGSGLWRELSLPFTPDAVAVGMADGVICVCTASHGILVSRDEGKSWNQVNLGQIALESFASAGGVLYAGGRGNLASSSDGGKSWSVKPLPGQSMVTVPSAFSTMVSFTCCVGQFTGPVNSSKA